MYSRPNFLETALQVSTALTDVHNTDKDGQASIAHTDITPSQFIMIDGKYKLNDFNRCRFIRWNRTDDKPCSYLVGRNPGKVSIHVVCIIGTVCCHICIHVFSILTT